MSERLNQLHHSLQESKHNMSCYKMNLSAIKSGYFIAFQQQNIAEFKPI